MILSGTFLDAAPGMGHAGAGKFAKSPKTQRRPTTKQSPAYINFIRLLLVVSDFQPRWRQFDRDSSHKAAQHSSEQPSFVVRIEPLCLIRTRGNNPCVRLPVPGISMLLPKSRTNDIPSKSRYMKTASRIKCHSASQVPASRQIVCFDSALLAQGPPDYWSDLPRLVMGLMAVVGRGSLHWDNPHHESKSILLGPHGPRSHQVTDSTEGAPFKVGEGVETRRQDSLVRHISAEDRTSEDKLIQTVEYPNSSQRSTFDRNLRERQTKSLFSSRCEFLALSLLGSL
ncbi:hypothetical protein BKA64DRAFT_635293 [Cadophora sp. MPI-SDFR-AT-0126]|nr:hypothetical protein BKA64DRAFT_635293 [Leotiomycetes sp. MPI-SDFR-AT-0126]